MGDAPQFSDDSPVLRALRQYGQPPPAGNGFVGVAPMIAGAIGGIPASVAAETAERAYAPLREGRAREGASRHPMITLTERAQLRCDAPDCTATLPVRLVLLPTGGFVPDVPAHAIGKWQLLADPQNPAAPYQDRCGLHASRLLTPER